MGKEQKIPKHVKDATLDIVYDLGRTLLGSPTQAKRILKGVETHIRRANGSAFSEHRIPWVLRLALDRILKGMSRTTRAQSFEHPLSATEQLKLDSEATSESRLSQVWVYFRRLTPIEQIVLILLHKHHVTLEHSSTALAIPIESLKLIRQQAMIKLEGWIWQTE